MEWIDWAPYVCGPGCIALFLIGLTVMAAIAEIVAGAPPADGGEDGD